MKNKGQFYRPLPGNAWNPLASFPRNRVCFCGSGVKHKKCCASKIMPYCSIEDAKKFASLIQFLKENPEA